MAANDAGARPILDASHAPGVQVGDHNRQTNVYQLSQRPPITWPHRIGVPPPLADHRQDRPADHALATALSSSDTDTGGASGGTAVVCQVVAGMGGVGKTQLAAHYAHHAWTTRAVDLLVWVTASSRDAITTSYATAAADLTGITDPDHDQGAARFLAWLAQPHHRRWLIVLDDLQTPADLNQLWPPTTSAGRTIVTTRRRDTALSSGRHLIQVGLFTPAESATYLADKLAHNHAVLAEADQLAEDLGHLPLALAQAATYILDRGLTCTTYRQRLADRRRTLTDLTPEPDALPDQHQATIAATWALSIDLADTLPPTGLARPVLQIAALLDPNTIPTALFTTTAVRTHLAAARNQQPHSQISPSPAPHPRRPTLWQRITRRPDSPSTDQRREQIPPVETDDVLDVLHGLHRLSLLEFSGSDSDTIGVHALVQRATREATPPHGVTALARAAADALVEIWPDIERDPAFSQTLRANTTALNTHAGPLLWNTTTGAHPVLLRAGTSLGEAGLDATAVDYYRDLLPAAERHLGLDHPDTLGIRGELAYRQGEAGDRVGTVAAFADLLTDTVRILGPDHPRTLLTRHTLADWRARAGDPIGAAADLANLLPDTVRILGPDHLITLRTRQSLAYWDGVSDPAYAAAALEELVPDMVRVLGPDHPETLLARAELAHWRGQAGDPADAVTALTDLLADQVRVLGPDHPDTLDTRCRLGEYKGVAGDPADAVDAFEKLLPDMVRVLGLDHPATLLARNYLASWRGQAGDPAGAVAAFADLLTDQLRVLGPDHPATLTTRHNLARWRRQAGNEVIENE